MRPTAAVGEPPTGAYLAGLLNNIFMTRRAPESRADAYEAVFAALAHPARRRVLVTLVLSGGSMTAGEIAAVFDHAWQTTTRHLRILERARLISHRRDGRTWIYRLERTRLNLVRDWLAHFSNDPQP